MEEDRKLIEGFKAGETAAFERLVLKYQKLIYAVIYRITNDMEDAKDLTQKTFCNAFKGIAYFRADASFKTWLYRIAINTGLNHIKEKRPNETDLNDDMLGRHDSTLRTMLDSEQKELIKKALAKLPERQKLAVTLRVYDDMSCSETAAVMGCSEGAVKAHYHHGVKKLRALLMRVDYDIRT